MMACNSPDNSPDEDGDHAPVKKVGLRLIRQNRTGICENEQIPSGNIWAQEATSSQRQILWDHKPRSCVIFKRWKTRDASDATLAIAEWLKAEHGFRIMIYIPDAELEPPTDDINLRKNSNLLKLYERYIPETDADLLICLGGDGTVLYASSLFPKAMPPMMSIAMGSLGFLTPLEFEHYKVYLNEIITKCWSPNAPKITSTPGGRAKFDLTAIRSPSNASQKRLSSAVLDVTALRSPVVATPKTLAPKTLAPNTLTPKTLAPKTLAPKTVTPKTGPQKRPALSLSTLAATDITPAKKTRKPQPATPATGPLAFGVAVTLRMRLICKIFRRRANAPKPTFEKEINSLNEVLVDRGSHASLVTLDILVNGEFLTTALADGIIIATPTGSTAYNLSAGGPLICPLVPAIALTPICPHTLSFRPILLPDSAEIIIKVSKLARGPANICVDGGEHILLRKGEYIAVSMSNWPMPTLEVPRHLCFPIKAAARLAALSNQKTASSSSSKKPSDLKIKKSSKGKTLSKGKGKGSAKDSPRLVNPNNETPNEAGHRDHQIACWIDAITEKLGWNQRDIQKRLPE